MNKYLIGNRTVEEVHLTRRVQLVYLEDSFEKLELFGRLRFRRHDLMLHGTIQMQVEPLDESEFSPDDRYIGLIEEAWCELVL